MYSQLLNDDQATAVAKIAIGDDDKAQRIVDALPLVGRNVIEYLTDGEVNPRNYDTVSLVITSDLNEDRVKAIREYLDGHPFEGKLHLPFPHPPINEQPLDKKAAISDDPQVGQMKLEDFDILEPDQPFRIVVCEMEGYGTNPCMFVAQRGMDRDWAVYYYPFDRMANVRDYSDMIHHTLNNGEKVTIERAIRSIQPCSDAVFQLYRY